MAASNRTPAFTTVLYAVPASGDTWFQPTIASSDSPDYTADNTEALAQCEMMNPQGEQVVG
tara:strand:- start:786 stop:968 length:183 start_codon:yes stop_codon:yes gene_type:complete